MYNEELKTRFIQEYTKSISRAEACVMTFNAIEPFEVQWGCDLCMKSKDELEPVIAQFVGVRSKSKWTRVIIFQKYVKWCLENNIPGACDGMLHVEYDGTDRLRNQMVSNPIQLQAYLDAICEPEQELTIDNIYRCFYWMAYSGMDEHDIINVRCKDVDFANMVIRCGGEEFEIYKPAIPAIRNAATLTEFVYKHPNYPPDKKVIRNRTTGDSLIRGIKSSTTLASLRVELSRRSKRSIDEGRTDKQLSYYKVWLSGLFYRMYQRELAGIPVDFSGAASRFMEGKTYKLDTGRNTTDAKKRAVVNDYLRDYERWKSAFRM